MPAKKSENNKMKTRLRLELNGTILNNINPVNELRVRVNGTTLNNSIPVNEQPKKKYKKYSRNSIS